MNGRRVALGGLAGLLAVLLVGVAVLVADRAVFDRRSPGEAIRYLERRLQGHPRFEALAGPVLARWRTQVERPVALSELPAFGRGPRALGPVANAIVVADVAALRDAVSRARPGDVLLLAPGRYRIDATLHPRVAGRADAPITLRGGPGAVLESNTTEAIKIDQPFWVFEGLRMRGTCRADHDCEHAFHVVGGAVGTVIRDCRLEDFNAALKVNGEDGRFPDGGRLERCDLINGGPRETDRPVSPVDIVGASGWTVADNRVVHFVKRGGNGVSYGIFMKGGGRNGRIERNVVVCTPNDISQAGVRVGISLGGGLTGDEACRQQPCLVEHQNGLVASNLVAHCNDAGIDVNRSTDSRIEHNTLVNTAGILLRDEPSSALLRANLFDGRIRVRAPAMAESIDNRAGDLRRWFAGADALDLRWTTQPDEVPTAGTAPDLCGRARGSGGPPGALSGAPC